MRSTIRKIIAVGSSLVGIGIFSVVVSIVLGESLGTYGTITWPKKILAVTPWLGILVGVVLILYGLVRPYSPFSKNIRSD